jgi:hypothetical protein
MDIRGRSGELGFAGLLVGFVETFQVRTGQLVIASPRGFLARRLGQDGKTVACWMRRCLDAQVLAIGGPKDRFLVLGPGFDAWEAKEREKGRHRVPVTSNVLARRDLSIGDKLTMGACRSEQAGRAHSTIKNRIACGYVCSDRQRGRMVGIAGKTVWRGRKVLQALELIEQRQTTRRGNKIPGAGVFSGQLFRLLVVRTSNDGRPLQPVLAPSPRRKTGCLRHQGLTQSPSALTRTPRLARGPPGAKMVSFAMGDLIGNLTRSLVNKTSAARSLAPRNRSGKDMHAALNTRQLSDALWETTGLKANWHVLTAAGIHPGKWEPLRSELARLLHFAGIEGDVIRKMALECANDPSLDNPVAVLASRLTRELSRLRWQWGRKMIEHGASLKWTRRHYWDRSAGLEPDAPVYRRRAAGAGPVADCGDREDRGAP